MGKVLQKNIDLQIYDSDTKQNFFNFLRDSARIPLCRNCGKLFDLGFPDSEEGVADNLICHENDLICDCEYFKMVKNLYNAKEDGVVDIHSYYEVFDGLLTDSSKNIRGSKGT